jgi:hypothetical protein
MKKLSEVVNVVPVIAKADSLTLEERESFKQKVSTNHHQVALGEAILLMSRLIDPGRALPSQYSPLSI